MLSSEMHSSNAASAQSPTQTGFQPRPSLNRQPQRTDSTHLLQGGRELLIAHAGEEYRLRLTRNDKLILTK